MPSAPRQGDRTILWGVSDFHINASARSVLARHWVATERLTARAINRVLYLRGLMEYRPGRARKFGDITPSFLAELERELKRIRYVRKIQFQLDNWKRDESGGWVRTDGKGKARRASSRGGATRRTGDPPSPA